VVATLDQQLCREMAFLGELGIVEGRIARFKIGATVLLVGIEEEGIESSAKIMVPRNIFLDRPRGLDCCACLTRYRSHHCSIAQRGNMSG
jgi:hypothetical protein